MTSPKKHEERARRYFDERLMIVTPYQIGLLAAEFAKVEAETRAECEARNQLSQK
jgi:hypothetical protein